MVINKEESGDWDIVDNLDQNSEIWPRSDLAVTGGWNSCLFRKKCLLSALIISSHSASYFKVAYHLPFFSETDRTLISLWGWHYYSQMWEAAALWKEDPSQLEAVTCVGPGGLVMVINNWWFCHLWFQQPSRLSFSYSLAPFRSSCQWCPADRLLVHISSYLQGFLQLIPWNGSAQTFD